MKNKMGKQVNPETVTKNCVERNAVFADIFNLAFSSIGVSVVEESLKPHPSRMLGKRERDVVKRGALAWGLASFDAMLFVECQTHVDYSMPIRLMSYEAEALMWEVSKKADGNEEKNSFSSDDEFLCKIRKEDGFIPVFSVVVYWGVKPWDVEARFFDLCKELPSLLRPILPDYPMRIVDIMRLKRKKSKASHLTSVKLSFFMQKQGSEDEIDKLLQSDFRFRRISSKGAAVLRTLAKLDINADMSNEDFDMCKAWTDHKESGVSEGLILGRIDGSKKRAAKTVLNLQRMAMDVPFIATATDMSESEVIDIINNHNRGVLRV